MTSINKRVKLAVFGFKGKFSLCQKLGWIIKEIFIMPKKIELVWHSWFQNQ